MTQVNDKSSPWNVIGKVERKVVRLSAEELVTTGHLNQKQLLPQVIQPHMGRLDIAEWASNNRTEIDRSLRRYGGILFRGFGLKSVVEFERFIRAISGEALEYKERSSPRSQIGERIYTSTDHPPDKSIFLHNEQSYNLVFPMKIFFFCIKTPEQLGATPIADTRRVFGRILNETRERLMKRKYRYVRNFGEGFGLSWQEAFQTTRRSEVEEYCRAYRIEYEWRAGNRLRTEQVREVAARHPETGEWVWFNHLTFFHISTLDEQAQEVLRREVAEECLPNNTYYGDGSAIEEEVMRQLREAYEREKVRFDWEEGDVLMLDNMLVAHGREPYIGERTIAVGMAEYRSWDNL
jgi:alpha-ketoglutarate-dependent taurine dioxygenase